MINGWVETGRLLRGGGLEVWVDCREKLEGLSRWRKKIVAVDIYLPDSTLSLSVTWLRHLFLRGQNHHPHAPMETVAQRG